MTDSNENNRASAPGEQLDLARPLDTDAAQLPAGGKDAAVTGMPPQSLADDGRDRYEGMGQDVPPARMGQSSAEQAPAEIRGDTSNSGGTRRIDPATHIPPPVTQEGGLGPNSQNGGRS